MKELLEDYQRKYKTINEMIRIETDEETLGRLRTKSICYREFITEVERTIRRVNEEKIANNLEIFISALAPENNYVQKGFIPYLGQISFKDLTPLAIINKIHEHGFLAGIETGEYQKTLEIKKVLNIDISND